METWNSIDETQLREVIDRAVKAIQAKDIDALLPLFASDVVSFDVVGQLRYSGMEAIKKRMQDWFSTFEDGPIGYEISELSLNLIPNLAFCYRINHVNGALQTGQQLNMRWRETTCYRKLDGQWLIVHQHSSVPFDPKTGQASLTLES